MKMNLFFLTSYSVLSQLFGRPDTFWWYIFTTAILSASFFFVVRLIFL